MLVLFMMSMQEYSVATQSYTKNNHFHYHFNLPKNSQKFLSQMFLRLFFQHAFVTV